MQKPLAAHFLARNARPASTTQVTCNNAKMTIPLTFYVATELKAARDRAGLTNSQIAGRIGISEAAISRVMSGNQSIDIERIAAIAKACSQPVQPILATAAARYDKQKKAPHSKE